MSQARVLLLISKIVYKLTLAKQGMYTEQVDDSTVARYWALYRAQQRALALYKRIWGDLI